MPVLTNPPRTPKNGMGRDHRVSSSQQTDAYARNVSLARRASEGDREAFDELMASHAGAVFAIALARLGDPQDAEDLVQEAFLRAWLLLPRLRDHRAFTAWMMRLARNLAQDWNRSSVRYVARLASFGHVHAHAYTHDPRPRLEDDDALARVHESIKELPVHLREVLVLHFTEEWTASEIARHLDVHPSTVQRQIDKGLRLVRTQLSRDESQSLRGAKTRAQASSAAAILVVAALPAAARAELAIGLVPPAETSAGARGLGALSEWFTRTKVIAIVVALCCVAAVVVVTQRNQQSVANTPAVSVLAVDPMERVVTGTIPRGGTVQLDYSRNPMGVRTLQLQLLESGQVRTMTTWEGGKTSTFDLRDGMDFFASYYTSPTGPLMMDAILVEKVPDGARFTLETRTDIELGHIKDDPAIDASDKPRRLREAIRTREFYPTNPALRARTLALPELPLN